MSATWQQYIYLREKGWRTSYHMRRRRGRLFSPDGKVFSEWRGEWLNYEAVAKAFAAQSAEDGVTYCENCEGHGVLPAHITYENFLVEERTCGWCKGTGIEVLEADH